MNAVTPFIEEKSKRDVAIAVIERCGHFAFLLRSDGRWTFPGGKVDPNENAEQAAVRETLEESGLRILIYKSLGHHEKEKKIRHYFLAKAVGGSLRVAEPDKFQVATWLTPQEIINLVGDRLFPPVRAYFDKILHPSFDKPRVS